jgi:SpoVK/Ycf46/Vps4 family AAA+-type ATPase
MFEQAADEGAVLQVDEADSLLQDRRGAVRSWEVTQVNEMLTQMEDFDGVFIATTNLFDSLDAAAMRRFDTHVRLGYLRTEQAERMFGDLARQFAIEPLDEVRQALWRLDSLTPGDFAALLRMCRLAAPQDERELLERLRRVCGGCAQAARRLQRR